MTATTTTTTSSIDASPVGGATYDRYKELKEFDDSKIGVKGLVDAGITSIPRIFRLPPESLTDLNLSGDAETDPDLIPVIDLSGPRQSVIVQIRSAASTFGFFQVVNHSVPVTLLDRLFVAVKAVHRQPTGVESQYYEREMRSPFHFFSNVDLFLSKAASWRDTMQIRLGVGDAMANAIPEICRDEVIEWDREVKKLGEQLLELLSEGMGASAQRLKELSCAQGRVMVGHYYPHCPQPDQTIGLASHTDPGVLTVLLQDLVGGLQVKHEAKWLDVKPVHGALVINIGDILQIISNDEYKSGEHRVLANPFQEPRVSIAVFLNPGIRGNLYGPLPELVSPEKPGLFRHFTLDDFLRRFFTKELDGKSLINYYRIEGHSL
ncbi:hypothetical protein Dimus_014586 [Dionaea muscipula]